MKKISLEIGFVIFSFLGMVAGVIVKSLVHGYRSINIGVPGGVK